MICEQEILDYDPIFYIGFDKPYYNLKIHRNCRKNDQEMSNILHKDGDLWYNEIIRLIKERNDNKRTGKKR